MGDLGGAAPLRLIEQPLERSTVWLSILLGFLIFCLTPIAPAAAASCHKAENHTFCIAEIRRSAKYPWEYRVTLSRDGVKQAEEIYNCRDRVRVNLDGDRKSFQTGGTGDWICRLTRRS